MIHYTTLTQHLLNIGATPLTTFTIIDENETSYELVAITSGGNDDTVNIYISRLETYELSE